MPRLRQAGLRIALDDDRPARLALAADGQCAVASFEYAARHRVPLVLYVWDLPPWWIGRGKPDFIFVAGGRIRRLPRPIGGYAKRAGYFSRMRFVAKRSLQVWSPSRCTVADVRARFGIEAEWVPFCYDSDRFGPDSAGDPPVAAEGPPILLSVSRLVPHKNHQLLVRAAARLGRPVRVWLMGQGPEAAPLRRLAADLGVSLTVDDAWASDDAILAGYRAARVVVCPSRFEGLGLTPLEGLAMGRPVLASDIPPHREFAGGVAGFFDPDDEAGLAAGLTGILDRPATPMHPPDLGFLTIEACAERFLSRIEAILSGIP